MKELQLQLSLVVSENLINSDTVISDRPKRWPRNGISRQEEYLLRLEGAPSSEAVRRDVVSLKGTAVASSDLIPFSRRLCNEEPCVLYILLGGVTCLFK